MAKKRRDDLDLSGAAGGLTHNPFAALKGLSPSGSEGPVPRAVEAATPATPNEAPRGGAVELRRERKGRSGRTVTLVSWLRGDRPDGDALASLARDTARALGAGVAVEGDRLVVQGDQVARLERHLRETLGVDVVRGTAQ